MNLGFFVNSALLGVGLAMDAFSVSIANGLNEPGMSHKKMYGVAGTYAWFQFMMPMIGWFCVHQIAAAFSAFQKFIPWIALILLGYIGGKMLIEGLQKKTADDAEEAVLETKGKAAVLTFGTLMIQGIATSIDALSVGFTIADYNAVSALIACLIISVVTFVICMFGLLFGRRFGEKLEDKASILGGVILIGIGLEIFITNVFL